MSGYRCPACGCQVCPNCLGALCDCGELDYEHDRDRCEDNHGGGGVIHDVKITFTIREGMITRVRYRNMPDMTETVLDDPQAISDAVARVASAPVGGREDAGD